MVRTQDSSVWIVETKGREELDVPQMMARLRQWCIDATEASKEEGGTSYGFVYLDYYIALRRSWELNLMEGHSDTVEYDLCRDDWLQSQGIRMLRFWNNQMLMETDAVMEVIYLAVVLLPSPAGGRRAGVRVRGVNDGTAR